MSGWWSGRTSYVTLAVAIIVLIALLGLNAALASAARSSESPAGVLHVHR